jgi:hypothetical protein
VRALGLELELLNSEVLVVLGVCLSVGLNSVYIVDDIPATP